MQIAIQAFVYLSVIGGIVIGILLYYHKQTPSVWVTFATLVSLSLAFCLYWQNSILEKEKNTQPTKIPKLEEPTFSEAVDKVSFSLGEGGITDITDISRLKEQPREPFNFGGFKPVKIYISNDKIYADVEIYGGSNLPPIQIKRNKLMNKPPHWDFNSNRNALEIVNEKQIPIYQFIYKTPSHIVFNGIFPFPDGLILASEKGVVLNPTLPTTFELKRIFKYPSWQYPGEYEKKDANNPAVPRSRPAA
jgi:hypothetical protein